MERKLERMKRHQAQRNAEETIISIVLLCPITAMHGNAG
jgi:hypothetical protein